MKEGNQWSVGEGGNMPLGFGFRLAANEKAMSAFAQMSDAEKQQVVDESRQMHSRKEMEHFVNKLSERAF